MAGSGSKDERSLRDFALGYPETIEEFPWDHRAIKVRKKIFVTLCSEDGGLSITVKLPDSNLDALTLPFTEPTHYGLGKHGWITARFASKERPPLELLRDWIDESYRAIAPKKLIAQL